MKPWNFALIILGMFLFLNIFKASETSRVIAEASFSKVFLVVIIGALLAALGYALFLVPFNIAAGGVSGINSIQINGQIYRVFKSRNCSDIKN